jgi:hypothetical protein
MLPKKANNTHNVSAIGKITAIPERKIFFMIKPHLIPLYYSLN